jgi:hypothetical protein
MMMRRDITDREEDRIVVQIDFEEEFVPCTHIHQNHWLMCYLLQSNANPETVMKFVGHIFLSVTLQWIHFPTWNCYLPIQLVCSANDPTFSDLKQGISKTKDSISIWLLMPFSLEWLGIELQQYLQAEENPYCSENSLHSKPPLMICHMGNRFSRTKDRCSNSTSEKKTTKEHGKTCYCISCTWRTLKL